MRHKSTSNTSAVVDIHSAKRLEAVEARETLRRRTELVHRANHLLGSQLAEAILTQDPAPEHLIGLSKRASELPLRALTPLQDALDVAAILNTVVGPPTIQAWFIGLNPELNDQVPAEVIFTDPDAVMAAARRFVANG